jgi:hypothetical protein
MNVHSRGRGAGKISGWPRFSLRLLISLIAVSAIIAWLVVFDENALQLLRSPE